MAKIFIDPGHGAHDPGAVGKLSKEKDNVLKVGLRLKSLLESYGHTVKMSRSTDVFIGLSERARMANNWGADYFVSLHNNAATSDASGFETFVFDGPVSTATSKFQAAIHNAIVKEIGIRDRGMKRGNLAVLRESKMPAVLIEYAFISNANDERILMDKVEQLAQWTANGIIEVVGKCEVTEPTPPNLTVDGYWGADTTKALQRYFGTPVDGAISKPSTLIKAMQKWLGTPVDGIISEPYSTFIAALQRRMGTYVDGKLSKPSPMVKEMQRRLNNGKL